MKQGQPVYIVSPKRTAVGKAFKGGLRTKRPDDLVAELIRKMLSKLPSFDHALIEDVYMGCAMPEAEQGMNIGRMAALLAGLPDSVPGVTINRFCSSGLQSIAMAADRIAAGSADCLLAGGTENMTMIPMMGNKVVGNQTIMDTRPDMYLGMGLTAENVANDFKISREDQDHFALESHQKASAAIANGLFDDEIIEVSTQFSTWSEEKGFSEITTIFKTDDGPRADSSYEALAKLRPAFKADGSVTAGNSSQMSDGAGICLVVSEAFLKQHKLTPAARFCGFSVAGVPPRVMGIGPIEAIPKACKLAGITLKDIERLELNEAFAAQSLAVINHLHLDRSKINPTGGAIALGHPLGATGAKLTATLLSGMARDKQKYGAVSMCIGTGMGAAGIFENLCL